jgi:hypothetical protein
MKSSSCTYVRTYPDNYDPNVRTWYPDHGTLWYCDLATEPPDASPERSRSEHGIQITVHCGTVIWLLNLPTPPQSAAGNIVTCALGRRREVQYYEGYLFGIIAYCERIRCERTMTSYTRKNVYLNHSVINAFTISIL